MKRLAWQLPSLMLTLGLCACDSVKNKITAILDETIEETGGNTYEGEAIRTLTGEDFDEFTAVKGHVVLIDFYADWCGPCRQLSPVLETIVNDHGGKVLLGKVNVDDHKKLASEHRVRGIPDVRIFVDGKQVDSFVGMPPVTMVHQRIEAQLEKLEGGDGKAAKASKAKAQAKAKSKSKPAVDEANPDSAEPQPAVQPMDKDWMPPGIQRQ